MSLLFYYGEKFFIDSVLKYKHLGDAKEVRIFIAQESFHRKIHRDYTKWLDTKGYSATHLESLIDKKIQDRTKNSTDIANLAVTVAYEHLTTSLALFLLKEPERLDQMHPHFEKIWRWHCVEEIEHAATAFDLYVRAGGSYFLRVVAMMMVVVFLLVDSGYNAISLLKTDQELWKIKTIKSFLHFNFGLKHGLAWHLFPKILLFFRPGFHPRKQKVR